MPVYEIGISEAEITGLIRSLDEFKRRLERAEVQIVQGLADDAEAEMVSRLNAVTDPDGNIDAHVRSFGGGNDATVALVGSQAAYLEFGTGVIGARNAHELSAQVGWQYVAGSHYRTFRNGRVGWVYFDRSRGHYRVTSGITPQRIVLSGGRVARARVRYRVREALG